MRVFVKEIRIIFREMRLSRTCVVLTAGFDVINQIRDLILEVWYNNLR
jgi:hypothetical protein